MPLGPWREDSECFTSVFDAYHGEIYRYVASRLDIGHADDLASETFLVAYRGRTKFRGPDSQVRAWLYGIATNLIRRHRRDEERKYRALTRAETLTWCGDEAGADEPALAKVGALNAQRTLAAALRSMGRGDRDVLLLVALAELSYAEVAAALNIPQGTVGSRLNRARTVVRDAFGGVDPTRDQTGG